MPKNIHLSDFPEDKIVIFLEDEFRNKLLQGAIELFGRRKLTRVLGIKKLDTISRWKKGKINRGKNWITAQGIPLNKFKKLCSLLNFKLRDIEKYVVTYKAYGKSLSIKNPNLPITESPELFRVIAHLIGDGSAKSNNVSYFKNFNKKVLIEFAEDMKKVFGDIELSFNKDNIVFPIAITHILSKFYDIQFGTFSADVPKRLFKLPRRYSAKFIQGFFDDEGNVDSTCIRVYSFNKRLISNTRKLSKRKFPEIAGVSKIKTRERRTGKEYSFTINTKGLRAFARHIGFTHSYKKIRLKNYIRRSSRIWNHMKPGTTKLLILKSLSEKPKTVWELSSELNISSSSILAHLRGYHQKKRRNSVGLLERGFVEEKNTSKYGAIIWGITDIGRWYLGSGGIQDYRQQNISKISAKCYQKSRQ